MIAPSIRPLGDWLLVSVDPLKDESKGGILLVGDKSTETVKTGTVVRVGPGKKVGQLRNPIGVEPGEKVAFFRWNQEHQNGQRIAHVLGEGFALIKMADVLFAFPAGLSVEVN